MVTRKGMGKGKGKGFKNIIGKDPKTHRDSAKGKKQPQGFSDAMKKVAERPTKSKLTDDQQGFVDMFGMTALMELRKELDDKIESYDEEEDGIARIETEGGEEYIVFEDDDKAEQKAKDQVRDNLEYEPELFTQDWLQNFMTISKTDRNIIAGEEADNIVDNTLDDDQILTETGKDVERDQLQEQIDKLEGEEEPDQDKIIELEGEQEQLIEDAKEELREEKRDEIYDALEDPVNYFVEEHGFFSREDLLKQSFISIDIDEATDSAVATDGWQHFVATYSGDSIELPSGVVLARTN